MFQQLTDWLGWPSKTSVEVEVEEVGGLSLAYISEQMVFPPCATYERTSGRAENWNQRVWVWEGFGAFDLEWNGQSATFYIHHGVDTDPVHGAYIQVWTRETFDHAFAMVAKEGE